MAELGQMVVKVTGDLTELKSKLREGGVELNKFGKSGSQSIFNLTEKLKELQSNVFTEKDRGKIKLYNAEIKATEKQIASLSSIGTSSLGSLGAGVTKAFSSLRVLAQILPGVGIAGILAFASEPIIKYVSELFGASEAMKKIQQRSEDLKKTITGIFEGAGKEAAGVSGLISVLKSETETRERKLAAIKELQKISPEVFANLKLEGNAVIGLDSAYKNYLDSLKTVIAAKIIQAKLETAITRLLDLQGTATTTAQKALIDGMKKSREEEAKRLEQLGDPNAARSLRAIQSGFDNINASKLKLAQEEVNSLMKDLTELSKGVKVPEDKIKKDAETIEDVLRKLRANISAINIEEGLFNVDKSSERVNAFLSAIKTLVTKFKLDPNGDLVSGLFTEASIAKVGFIAKGKLLLEGVKIKSELQKLFKESPIEVPIAPALVGEQQSNILADAASQTIRQLGEAIAGSADWKTLDDIAFLKAQGFSESYLNGLRIPELTALRASVTKEMEAIAELTKTTLANSFSSIGETLGKSLANGNGNFLKDALGGVLPIMGDFLIQLGKAAIATSKLFLAIKASKVNPFTGIIGGIAAIAVGSLIKNIKLPGFANGVTNFGGGLAMVGERGPELVNLPRGANVIPNHALNSMSVGSQSINVGGMFQIRGKDLVYVLNEANQQLNRNT